ncbi:hypothetical protein [Streptomyces sp. NPDC056160]|uniref:hypothetical protein n=1 Tax=Streptomyces sp. NPDC056160 TaxID=3345731 RepID=UPI0035D774DD
MYSLTPGYRVPAVQRGLSRVETLATKVNAGIGGALLMSAALTPPPAWTFGAVGATAALLNVAPGPRSITRWATVGYRHLTERTAPAAMTTAPGATSTWALYPEHGTMQDAHRRAAWHDAFSRALTFAGTQARSAGIQVHVAHHAMAGEHTTHMQSIAVHVPKNLVGDPDRILDTLGAEFAGLGSLTPVEPGPVRAVTGRGPGWVALEDGTHAATARITGWPEETGGDLMPRLLLGHGTDRSLAVLYRPLPPGQSRRSAKWQRAASEAFITDKVKAEAHDIASSTAHGALVQGATLVDVDAYLTVWGDSPEAVTEARWQMVLTADRHRIQLDWLTGQQHRAHVMTTPHGATTRKGAIL